MSDIGGVSNNKLLEELGVTKQSNGTGNSELGQSEFFELMVAQMQNQDPLEPQTNGDFLAQLAQFRTSDGIASMQQSLDALTQSMQSNQALQASALVGRSVLVPGDTAVLKEGGQVQVSVELTAATQNLNLDVYDSIGQLVKRVPLGTHGAGDLQFTWDGTNQTNQAAAAGTYRMAVTGKVGQETMQFSTFLSANVDSVSLGQGQDLKLNVEGLGALNLSDVKRISE